MLTNFWFHSNLPLLSISLAHLGTVPVLIALHSGQGAALAPSSIPHGGSLPLHCQAIHWPTAEEKQDASNWVEGVSCHTWGPGYCMVDGTLVTLYAKLGHYGDLFFDHKSNYSLSLTLSCSHCKK